MIPEILMINKMDMKNKITVFENPEFGEIRSLLIEGEPWFVAKDICGILELSDVSMTLSRLDDDEKLIQVLFVSGQNRKIWIVNESGLYALIFQSRKPQARAFRKWVTSVVLPSIRKTGGFNRSEHDEPMLVLMEKMLELQNRQIEIMQSMFINRSVVNHSPQDVQDCTHVPEEWCYSSYSGQIIRDTRKSIGITQRDLSHNAGVDRTHLSHMENDRTDPRTSTFFRIVDGMNCVIKISKKEKN